MAMLAEPRRRKRYNLCPRGKALYEDGNRYGTKMLEKMGWSKGKGLGANENGAQEFVRVRFKNDAEGLGYEMRDDQWTTHEEGFNGLLKALNGEDSNEKDTNGDASASEEDTRPTGFGFKTAQAAEADVVKPKKLKENISGISLEEKSKYSKARVHYKKFTRGKDLAQYSEKDLANIFGKKATDEREGKSDAEEEKPVNPNFAGVQTVSTGLSVNDYFKQKMEAMKLRMANNNCNVSAEDNEATSTENNKENENERHMLKKNKDKRKEEEPQDDIGIEEPPKKRKKSKRVAEEDLSEQGKEDPKTEEIDRSKRKKKKKDKQRVEEEDLVSIEPASAEEKSKAKNLKMTEEPIRLEPELNEMPAKKKSKRSKLIDEGTGENVMDEKESIPEGDECDVNPAIKIKTNKLECQEETAPHSERSAKKKSKKERIEADEQHKQEKAPEEAEVSERPAKKKSKKDKTEAQEQPSQEAAPEEVEVCERPAEKKSKKKKAEVEDQPKQETSPEEAEVSERPEKKKSKKDKTEVEEQPKQETSPEEVEVSERPAKKKSKKDKAEAEEQPKQETSPEEAEVSEKPAKRKSKKKEVEVEQDLLPPEEAEGSEKPTKKKSKKSKTEDREELNIEPAAEEETTSQTKRKSKKNKVNVETETTSSVDELTSNVSAADAAINSGNDSDSTPLTANANGILSMQELISLRDSFNIYKISTFSAERFHSFDMSAFKNASLSEITGYRIDDSIQLEVVETKYDINNIMNLWEGRQSKYPYTTLVRNVFKKLKKNKRLLKSDIDMLKKCQAFTGI